MNFKIEYLKRKLPSSNDCEISFKFNFCGGYALKVIQNRYYLNCFDGNFHYSIYDYDVKEILEYLKNNEYTINKHSVLDYDKLEA